MESKKLKPAKQALADAIHQNGGWPIEVHWLFSTSSRVGAISFWVCRPKFNSTDWFEGVARRVTVMLNRRLPNWHQCILSREEYYHAYPKADADGWIEWRGGECPVGEGDRIDVKFSDGDEFFDVGSYVGWGVDAGCCNIIAYRLHKPEQADPEFCESVARSIQEPDEQVWTNPPSIEQLASDYRDAKDYAERKQQEADDAKADADARLKTLELAGEAIGLLVSPITAKQGPKLVIAVKVGDEVECIKSNVNPGKYMGRIGTVLSADVDNPSTPYLVDFGGAEKIWCHEVKFIRRP